MARYVLFLWKNSDDEHPRYDESCTARTCSILSDEGKRSCLESTSNDAVFRAMKI